MWKITIALFVIITFLAVLGQAAPARNPYKVLGISRSATEQEISRAFRKLSTKYHPDRSPDTEEKYKDIVNAYEILKDPETRRIYDMTGTTDPQQQQAYNNHWQFQNHHQHHHGQHNPFGDFEEIMRMVNENMRQQAERNRQAHSQSYEEDYYDVMDQWGNIIRVQRRQPLTLSGMFIGVLKWLLTHPIEVIGFLLVYFLVFAPPKEPQKKPQKQQQ